jgi:hypothetical protein
MTAKQTALAASLLCLAAAFPAAAQESFATPQEAARALVDAAQRNDSAAMLKIFGPQGKDIVDSGDPTEDKAARAEFARRAAEKLQAEPVKGNPDRVVIVVGSENWPVPVPLVRKSGQWHFDAAKGRVEILARRVGRNELAAIDVSRAYVEAQNEYAAHDRDANGVLEYAQKIVSTPGKKDGLYWEGESQNLVPKAFADAAAAMMAEGKKPMPYHGYYFHILKAQGPDAPGGARNYVVKGMMMGGFALVAFPAEYGVSGVKTFIVNHDGMVYEKDLGPTTTVLARQMTRFNPDKTWQKVQGE